MALQLMERQWRSAEDREHTLTSKLAACDSSHTSLTEQLHQAKQELASLRSTVHQLSVDLESERTVGHQANAELEAQCQVLQEQLGDCVQMRAALSDQVSACEGRLEQANAANQALTQQLQHWQTDYQAMCAEFDILRNTHEQIAALYEDQIRQARDKVITMMLVWVSVHTFIAVLQCSNGAVSRSCCSSSNPPRPLCKPQGVWAPIKSEREGRGSPLTTLV